MRSNAGRVFAFADTSMSSNTSTRSQPFAAHARSIPVRCRFGDVSLWSALESRT
jgi:hypothetical protein